MHSALLKQVEDAVMVEVPPDLLAELQAGAGQAVCLQVERGALSLSRPQRGTYRLSELLSQCDFSIPPSEEELEWTASPAVGRELI